MTDVRQAPVVKGAAPKTPCHFTTRTTFAKCAWRRKERPGFTTIAAYDPVVLVRTQARSVPNVWGLSHPRSRIVEHDAATVALYTATCTAAVATQRPERHSAGRPVSGPQSTMGRRRVGDHRRPQPV